MKTTIIIIKRGEGYTATIGATTGTVLQGARCGLTPHDAATWSATMMLRYASLDCNPQGGVLMAPPEVLELVPTHLRSIEPAEETNARILQFHKKCV
jgi:hypothetical protein